MTASKLLRRALSDPVETLATAQQPKRCTLTQQKDALD